MAEARSLSLRVDRRTSTAGWVAAGAPAIAILATPMTIMDRSLLAGAYALTVFNAWWRERSALRRQPDRVTLTEDGRVRWRLDDAAFREAPIVDAWLTGERCVLTLADGRAKTRIAVARAAQPDRFRRLCAWLRLSRWGAAGEDRA